MPSRSAALLEAALALGSEHELELVLGRIVESATAVVGARYAALGRYDEHGEIQTFVHVGADAGTVARIGHLPRGRGLLGEVIVADGPIRLDDLGADPRSCGLPPHHPPMLTFLGVPVATGTRRYGNLYLTEKRDGRPFDDEDERLIVTLAAFAAAAIENALLVATERERATALAELAAAREREHLRQEMLARVIDAQEAERARVARDLHDEIGQGLTSVLLGLRLVETSLASHPPNLDDAREHSADLHQLVTQALREVRRLAFELRPTVLDDVGLVAALQRLVADVTARRGIVPELAVDGLDGQAARLPSQIETVAYRMVQEALTNALRHSRGSSVSVVVARSAGQLRVLVEDDGTGFDPAAVPATSLGLRGMRERAALVGGSVTVTSAPGLGTAVVLEVPLA
jgi:signal transduction histidine kinase